MSIYGTYFDLTCIKDPVARAKAEAYNEMLRKGQISAVSSSSGLVQSNNTFGDLSYTPNATSSGMAMIRTTFPDWNSLEEYVNGLNGRS